MSETSSQSPQTGADAFAQILLRHRVDTVFCITGAGNLALVDACAKQGIRVIYSHHEQAAVMEAAGWARVTGRTGVALVTTGGGAANAVTGVLSASLDSVPLLVVSGNESTFHIQNMSSLRAFGVQGFESVAVMAPIAKLARRVEALDEVLLTFETAFQVCIDSRPGPVFVDFPMNLQRQLLESTVEALPLDSGSAERAKIVPSPADPEAKLLALGEALFRAKRPLLYFGAGIRSAGAVREAIKFAEDFGLPFILSWSAIDFCDETHPLNFGRAGIYGDRHVNLALQQADLLLALGTRLAIPQVGYDRNDFAREAERWVVDVDPTELSKFDSLAWNLIQADAGTAIRALHARERSAERLSDLEPWISRLGELSREFPRSQQIGSPAPDGFIHSFDFVQELCGLSTNSTIVVTDVGAGLLTGHYGWRVKRGQRIFTSQGLGEMGFGLPGAIGAQVSSPEQTVICLNTDGGIMFNLQEMQLVKTYELPIKLVIFNNMGYTMIRSSQDNLFHGRRNGSEVGQDIGFPRFSEIAAVFGMRHTLVDSVEVARAKLPDVLSSAQAELIEVKMSADQLYLPRLATGKNTDGSFSSPPIEDLTPRLNADFLARWLGKEPVADE